MILLFLLLTLRRRYDISAKRWSLGVAFLERSSSHVSLNLEDLFVLHVVFGMHTCKAWGAVFCATLIRLGDSPDLFTVQPKDG